MAKYKASEIANFLVFLMSDSCDDLTNMKLNKLLYYAQGHYLRKNGQALFDDAIEAWLHGPVVRSVYNTYKKYSDKPNTTYDAAAAEKLDNGTKAFLVDIARRYGRYTASTLRNMTHKPKSPWSEVNEGEEISTNRIRDYFLKNEPEIGPLELELSEDDFIGRRDSNGILVFPEGWNDEEVYNLVGKSQI